MTDETSAPAGGEAIVSTPLPADAPEEFSSSEQAAKYFISLREKNNEQSAESAEEATAEDELSVEDNAGPEEVPGETQEADPDAEKLPPVEPPRSWTKEAKDRWSTIPREAQEEFARIELGREREFLRNQKEAADERKALKAERETAEKARQQYEAQLPALMQTLQDAQQSAFADIRTVDDVTKLANEDPFRYLQWQAHQTKLQAVNAELERAKGQQNQKQQSEWTEHVQKENQLAAELIPELADKEKGPALMKRAADRLSELGFSSDELNDLASGKSKLSIYDHRFQQLVFSDLKLADIQKAPKALAAKPVPPVQRPGTARPVGQANSERIQALTRQLNETGSLKVAQELRALQTQRRAS